MSRLEMEGGHPALSDMEGKATPTDPVFSGHSGAEEDFGTSSMRDRRQESRTRWERMKAFLVDKGVEERGIVPRPEDERETLSAWRYLPQFTMWAAWNTNVLTVSQASGPPISAYSEGLLSDKSLQFSEGVLGPALFGLDLKSSVLCIIFFTAVSCVPPAYLATNGPKTGMRQMIQARYAVG